MKRNYKYHGLSARTSSQKETLLKYSGTMCATLDYSHFKKKGKFYRIYNTH